MKKKKQKKERKTERQKKKKDTVFPFLQLAQEQYAFRTPGHVVKPLVWKRSASYV